MGRIEYEEKYRTFPIFFFLFIGYLFLWNAYQNVIPLWTIPLVPAIAALLTYPVRIWVRRRLVNGRNP